jgi:hypothetical protein
MRQIHPVSFHEKFVASGVYEYYFDDRPTGSIERWSIHELPDGAQLVRVDQRWASGSPKEILIEAWRSPLEEVGGRIERLDISALGRDGNKGKATYMFESDRVQVGYTVDDKQRQQSEISRPPNCVPSVNSTLFLGFLLANVAKANGECIPICSCNPFLSYDVKIEEFGAAFRELGVITIAGKSRPAWRCQRVHPCALVSEDRVIDWEVLPSVWLDEYSIVLTTEYPGQDGIVALLTQYARRPEPPES